LEFRDKINFVNHAKIKFIVYACGWPYFDILEKTEKHQEHEVNDEEFN
jgi:hypothetical protein